MLRRHHWQFCEGLVCVAMQCQQCSPRPQPRSPPPHSYCTDASERPRRQASHAAALALNVMRTPRDPKLLSPLRGESCCCCSCCCCGCSCSAGDASISTSPIGEPRCASTSTASPIAPRTTATSSNQILHSGLISNLLFTIPRARVRGFGRVRMRGTLRRCEEQVPW
eukprot:359802-Chlamydomonas_euryale.AAC.15